MKHDELACSELVQEAHAVFSLMTICVDIFVPALVEIGEAWYEGRIRVTTEHFASAFLRGKLLSLFQAYPARRSSPYILIGCAPTESFCRRSESGGKTSACLSIISRNAPPRR